MEHKTDQTGLGPRVSKTRSSDALSRVISVAAFVFSALGFALQYWTYERIIYDLTETVVHPKADQVTVQSVMMLYNLGNRAEALIDANAAVTDFDERKETVDQACDPKKRLVWLSRVGADLSGRVPGQYGGVIEVGKILPVDLRFSLPTGAAPDIPQSAVVCLDLRFSDNHGNPFRLHKSLDRVKAVTENGSIVSYVAPWVAGLEERVQVLSESYIWPFQPRPTL